MNEILRELISEFFDDTDGIEITKRIRSLQATEVDFSDELLESFGAESRKQIYGRLLIWTDQTNWLKILERRADSELDWECNKRLQFMIKHLREQRG